MKSKKYLISILFISLLTIAFTASANAFGKTIRVKLTQSYNYLLNNKQILQDQPALFYNNILYVPAADFAKELGYTVEYDNNTAVITQTAPSQTPSQTPAPPASQTSSVTGKITAIDFSSKSLTISPEGSNKAQTTPVVVYATDATKIVSSIDNQPLTFNDLDTNLNVAVTYQTTSTKSIPPQTINTAQTITILTPSQISKPQPR